MTDISLGRWTIVGSTESRVPGIECITTMGGGIVDQGPFGFVGALLAMVAIRLEMVSGV